jgi:hypothetical protein
MTPEIMPAIQAAHGPSYKPISVDLSFIISLDTLHAPVSFLARMRTRAGVESDSRPRFAVLVDDPEYGQLLELDRYADTGRRSFSQHRQSLASSATLMVASPTMLAF